MFRDDDTAKEVLDHLKAEVEKRRANAYRIRQIEPPEATPPTPTTGTTPEQQRKARIDELMAKRGQ